MRLEQAIKEIDKIFFKRYIKQKLEGKRTALYYTGKRENLPTFVREREKYVESIKRLYDKGYELIKRRKNG